MGIQRKVIPVILALVTPLLSASQCELTDIKPTEPDVQLTAAPISIETGQSTTLSWNSDVSSHISISPDVGVVFREMVGTPTIGSRSGSVQLQPVETVTYVATAWNAGAESTDSVTVTVTNSPTTPGTTTLVGSFSFDNVGEEPYVQTVRFTGNLVSSSGNTGDSQFSISTMNLVQPDAHGIVSFTKSGLQPGSWTINAVPEGVAGPIQCLSVRVPGVIRLSVAEWLPECGG